MLIVYIVWRKEKYCCVRLVKVFKKESIASIYAANLDKENDQPDISYIVEYQEVA